MYNPGVGRFLQRDPIDYMGEMGLYSYSKSSPVKFLDPTGTQVIVSEDIPVDAGEFLSTQMIFVGWYYGGEGKTLRLQDTGLMPDLMKEEKVRNFVDWTHTLVTLKSYYRANQQFSNAQNCLDSKFDFSHLDSASFNLTKTKFFSLGRTTMDVFARCSIRVLSCICCPSGKFVPDKIEGACKIKYRLYDSFTDPFDGEHIRINGKKVPIPNDPPPGRPYLIEGLHVETFVIPPMSISATCKEK